MMGQQSAPSASVIIAAYNAEDTLDAQLEALSHEKSAHSFEILVCDNGSTDGTAALVQRRTSSMPALRFVDASARRGPAAARNIGASAARGEVLLFCDADDVIAPGWLDALYDAAAEADLVAGKLEGRALNQEHRASVSWEVSSDITIEFWPKYPAGASSNLGVRAHVFHEVGGFDETLRTGEDIDLCWRIQIAGYSFARCPQAVVHSRQRDGRRAVFRQAYSYGAGHRALKVKYRHFIAASNPKPHSELQSEKSQIGPADSGPNRSLGARLRSALLTPTGQANVAWRLGEWLGARQGHIHADIRPLDGP